jgi:hypothetical protein
MLVSNAAAFAICMAPALVMNILASALKPVDAWPLLSSHGDVDIYLRAALVYVGVSVLASFSQWICASAVMIGMRWAERGYPPKPLTWMEVSSRRIPSLFFTFLLPVIPALIPLCMWIATEQHIDKILGDVNTFDLASMRSLIQAESYEGWAAVALALFGVPFACLATASMMLGDLSAPRAILVAIRQAFSRMHYKRALALSLATVCAFVAGGMVNMVVSVATQYVPAATVVWNLIQNAIDAAFLAFVAAVFALAWLTGYISPLRQPQTSPMMAERAV